MRGSLFFVGFLVFALGIVLSLPTIILNASASNPQTKTEAVTLIVGNVVKDVSSMNSYSPSSLFGKIPSLLVLIGVVLMAIALLFKF